MFAVLRDKYHIGSMTVQRAAGRSLSRLTKVLCTRVQMQGDGILMVGNDLFLGSQRDWPRLKIIKKSVILFLLRNMTI